MNTIPTDPDGRISTNPCETGSDDAPVAGYLYRTNAGAAPDSYATKYVLTASMSVSTSNDGHECTGLKNWLLVGGALPQNCAANDYCYGVQNP